MSGATGQDRGTCDPELCKAGRSLGQSLEQVSALGDGNRVSLLGSKASVAWSLPAGVGRHRPAYLGLVSWPVPNSFCR